MQQYRFKQVDVFTATAYFGNPLAVVLVNGQALDHGNHLNAPDEAAMQRFANWTNLSETAFLLPPLDPAADYRVRIFTPASELAFAGHPTLGSCHSWLESGGKPKQTGFIMQECQAGLIRIRREPGPTSGQDRLAFAAPPLRRSSPDPALLAQVNAALGLEPAEVRAAQWLDNGPVYLGLLLDSPETVLRLSPNLRELERLKVNAGLAAIHEKTFAPALIARANRESKAFGERTADTDSASPGLEVRAFAPWLGINEDPVTGSVQAALAQWLMDDGLMPGRYIASQGVCIGRAGMVHLERDGEGQVWVGGQSRTCVDGYVTL
jgi:PhzF family phenazine biosynthesis protein